MKVALPLPPEVDTVIAPLRAAPVFAAALKVNEPLPDPEAPLATVSQGVPVLLTAAVHEHPVWVVTVTVLFVTPAAGTDSGEGGESVYEQTPAVRILALQTPYPCVKAYR